MTSSASVVRAHDALLVVIDIQDRLAAVMPRRDEVVRAAQRLVRVAGLLGMPIVVTRQYPKGLGDLVPELAEAIADAEASGVKVTHADKVAFDCFAEPTFARAVAESGRSQLLLVGMETHICVTQTALAGLRLGHEVHVVADGCCSRETAAHDVALVRLAHAGASMTCWESSAYEAVGEAGTERFRGLLDIVKG